MLAIQTHAVGVEIVPCNKVIWKNKANLGVAEINVNIVEKDVMIIAAIPGRSKTNPIQSQNSFLARMRKDGDCTPHFNYGDFTKQSQFIRAECRVPRKDILQNKANSPKAQRT